MRHIELFFKWTVLYFIIEILIFPVTTAVHNNQTKENQQHLSTPFGVLTTFTEAEICDELLPDVNPRFLRFEGKHDQIPGVMSKE